MNSMNSVRISEKQPNSGINETDSRVRKRNKWCMSVFTFLQNLFEVSCSTFGYAGYQKTSLDQSEFGIS